MKWEVPTLSNQQGGLGLGLKNISKQNNSLLLNQFKGVTENADTLVWQGNSQGILKW